MLKNLLLATFFLALGTAYGITLEKIPDSRLDVTAFCCDSSETRLFVGLANASVWKSENGGNSWESIGDRICSHRYLFGVEELYALDKNADTVFCRSWNGKDNPIYQYAYSVDGGDTWDIIDTNSNVNIGHQLVVDQTNHSRVIHIDSDQVSLSEDFCETWETWLYDPHMNQKSSLIQHPDSSNVFYLTGFGHSSRTDGGVYHSDDYCRTWAPVFNAAELLEMESLYITDFEMLSNDELIFSFNSGRSEGSPTGRPIDQVVKLNPENSNVEILEAGLPEGHCSRKLVESNTNEGTIFIHGLPAYFQGGHGLYRSTDFGNSFQRVEQGLPPDLRTIYNLYQNDFNDVLYTLTQSYGIFKSTDGGLTWDQMALNMNLGNAVEFSLNNDAIFYRSFQSSDHISHYDIPSNSFQHFGYPTVTGDTTLILNPNVIPGNNDAISTLVDKYAYSQEYTSAQVIKTEDNGENWMEVGDPIIIEDYTKFVENVYCGETINRIVVINEEETDLIVHTSVDTGRTWTSSVFQSCDIDHNKQIAQTDNFISILLPDVGIFRSADNGATWENLDFPNVEDIEIYHTFLFGDNRNDNLYAFGNLRAWEYDGEGWCNSGQSVYLLENMWDICVIDSEETAFMATNWRYNRVWYKPTLEAPWENLEVEAEFLDESTNHVFINYDSARERVWISNQLGLHWFDVAQLDVKDESIQLHPAGYEILTTYPNPFNASTKIEFILEEPGEVSLKLYDINGRLVRELLDEKRDAGKHTLNLDGSQLASGTYFLKLRNGDKVHNKKLVMVK